jgi:hypothetical protein
MRKNRQISIVTAATPRMEPAIVPADNLSNFKFGAPLESVKSIKGVLPDNHHGQNAQSDSEIERNCNHTVSERFLCCENEVLGEQIDDDRESAGYQRGDKSRSNNPRDPLTLVPPPYRSMPTQSGNTSADDGADD